MCRIFPRPVLWQTPLHALLSVNTLSDTAPLVQIPKSAQPAKKPRPSLAPLMAAEYSASPLLKATILCVVLHAFKQMSPTMMQPPFVLFLVCTHPAQSESTTILTSLPTPSTSSLIFCTTLGRPLKYLASFFNFRQLAHVGLAISRQSSFTANLTSGRS